MKSYSKETEKILNEDVEISIKIEQNVFLLGQMNQSQIIYFAFITHLNHIGIDPFVQLNFLSYAAILYCTRHHISIPLS